MIWKSHALFDHELQHRLDNSLFLKKESVQMCDTRSNELRDCRRTFKICLFTLKFLACLACLYVVWLGCELNWKRMWRQTLSLCVRPTIYVWQRHLCRQENCPRWSGIVIEDAICLTCARHLCWLYCLSLRSGLNWDRWNQERGV